ncbi:MAG: hypothetical protein Q9165_006114 [Trypethelium subeluteriae]
MTVYVVDYNNAESLRFALSGIDIVVSTILGPNQLRLIEAAIRARVRRFIPAEFEGNPRLRPVGDPLDRGRHAARDLLQQYRNRIQSMPIICGIFYERFQPGGLNAARIGATSGFSREGDYIMDINNMTAQVPVYNRNSQYTTICMTSVRDVARLVVRALDLERWPPELSIHGERMTVKDVVNLVSNLKGEHFQPITWHIDQDLLRRELSQAVAAQDIYRQRRTQALMATAEDRYNFRNPNYRQVFPDFELTHFQDWVCQVWNLEDDDDE